MWNDHSTIVTASDPTVSPTVLRWLADHPDAEVRAAAFGNIALNTEVLDDGSYDPDARVRAAVAANPMTRPLTIATLTLDPHRLVVVAAEANPMRHVVETPAVPAPPAKLAPQRRLRLAA